jgi:hypothetical protein
MSTTVIDRPRAAQRGAANGTHTIQCCERNGNWLDAVMVLHLLHTPRDTCN